jgi:hypothetical protein
VSLGQYFQWQDLFMVVDDGAIPLSRYAPIEVAIREQGKVFPGGAAILCILPPEARPPPDEVKRAVKAVLTRVASSISCLTYVIEGTGFRGVAARATLVGMKIFSSRPYPIYVEVSLLEALSKMTAHMVNGHLISIELVLKQIAETRLLWKTPVPTSSKDNELHLK